MTLIHRCFPRLVLLAVVTLGAGCVPDRAQLDEPTQAVVAPNGRIYVSDGYANARVVVYDHDGKVVLQWGSKGYGQGQFNTPHGIALMSDGTVLVADRDNGRVQRFSPDGRFLEEWFGPEIGRPWSVAVADDNTVYVVDGGDQDADNPRSGVTRLDSNGRVLCRWSAWGDGPGELDWGHMVAVSEKGDVFVADLNNERVVKFVRSGECDYQPDLDWPVEPLPKGFVPLGLAVAAERIYVSDQRAGLPILILDGETGQRLGELGEGLFENAHGLSVDGQTLWVTDRRKNAVTQLGLDGSVLRTLGGK